MAGFTPFPEADPLLASAGTDRLRPSDGILLGADHLRQEQLYHRARLARICAYLQGPGTVAGLDVRYDTTTSARVEVQVTEGLAVDYRGRLLEHAHLSCLVLADWLGAQAATPRGAALIAAGRRVAAAGLPDHLVTDLFADFRNSARRPEPAFATGNADQIDGVEPTLAQDGLHLFLVIRDATDDRLPESMISRLIPGAVTLAEVQRAKRQDLWAALGPRPETLAPVAGLPLTEHDPTQQRFGGVFLARLRLPLTAGPGGAAVFDTGFDMSAAAVQPDFAGRLYSYSAAELALLSGFRR